MKKSSIHAILATCISITSYPVLAEDKQNESDDVVYTLPTLIFDHSKPENNKQIANQKLPFTQGSSGYTVTNSLITKSASQTVSNLISNISGVQNYNNTGGNPLLYIRGQRANITVNGIPMNQFDSSAQSLNLIPFSSIESITISPVGNSVLYGSMGIGGQIDIKTNDEIKNLITLSPSYPVFGNNYLSLGTKLDSKWKILFNQQGQYTNGYRDFSRVIGNNLNFDLIRQDNNDKTTFFINEATQFLQFPGAISEQQASQNQWQAGSSKQNYNTQTIFTGIKNKHKFSQNVSTDSFITYQQLWANGDFPNSSNSEFSQYYNQLQIKPILETKMDIFGKHTLKTKIGLDTSFQNFKQTNVISDSNQNSYAVFVMPSINVTDSLTAGTGSRFGFITTDGQFSNGKNNSDVYSAYAYLFFLEQKWNQHYTTGARISRDYQLPFIDQSSLTPVAQTTFGLKPQTSISYSASQKIAYDAWNIGLDVYYMDIKNQIIFNPNNSGLFQGANINLPPTEQYGIILSGGIQPIDALGVGGSVTLSRNVFKNGGAIHSKIAGGKEVTIDVSGNSIPGISNMLAEVHSNYQIVEPINWYLQLLYTGSLYADGDFQNSLGKASGYFLLNSSVSYKLSDWLFSIRVNNIFNQRYNYFTTTFGDNKLYVYPADGTNGALMVTYEFK